LSICPDSSFLVTVFLMVLARAAYL
jgi:hypothetical protein